MNQDVKCFLKVWNWKMVLKHLSLTVPLTMVGGPWGLAIGLTYAIGDGIGKSKEWTDEDTKKFFLSHPDLFKYLNK